MSFLLDTNVVSEWAEPRPSGDVVVWLSDVDEDRVFLSVATLAEIRYGVDRMPGGQRRDRLAAWLVDDLPARFEHRILDIDPGVADAWGVVMARGQISGRTIGVMDAFFAATALRYALTLVTRNVADFDHLGVELLNPWTDGQ
ncbi:type II toxin-antitoxin system VapC family toxin [soil metagenome]